MIHHLAGIGRGRQNRGEETLKHTLDAAEQFLRANPWVAVAGAAVASGVLAAMSRKKPVRRESSRAAVRDWLDHAYATLPTRKQFQSVAKSAGVPTTLQQLKEKLSAD